MSITLRPYQQEAVNAVYKHLSERDDNPCIVLPTGTGKSLVIAQIATDAVKNWGGRVLLLAHVKELLEQNAEKIRLLCPDVKVGLYSAGLNSKDTDDSIIVAGIQSVYRKACELGAFDLVITDECHRLAPSGEGTYRTFLKDAKIINPNIRVIGLTATPFRLKGGLICKPENILNHVCYEAGIKEMIVNGYLSPLKSKAGKSKAVLDNLQTRAGEFIASQMQEAMDTEWLTRNACKEIAELTADRNSVLIFTTSVAHCEHVAAEIAKLTGQECGIVTGDTPSSEREQTLRRFKGERIKSDLFGSELEPLKYLANVNVLTTGFDATNIDCVVLLRPTASAGLLIQMCLDMKTEVLTPDGWKRCHEIATGDIVGSYDLDKQEIVYTKALDKVHRPLRPYESIYGVSAPHLNIRVTNNHNMVVRCRSKRITKWQIEEAQEAVKRKETFVIPVAGKGEHYKDEAPISDSQLEFVGWFLTDGCINDTTLMISQSVKKYHDDVRQMLTNSGMPFTEYRHSYSGKLKHYDDNIRFTIPKYKSKDGIKGWAELEEWLDKDVPEIYATLSSRQFGILLGAMDKANGHHPANLDYTKKTMSINLGCRQRMANRIQQLAIERGFRCNVYSCENKPSDWNKTPQKQWGIHIRKQQVAYIGGTSECKNKLGIKRCRLEPVKYDSNEWVWCLTTTYGTLVTRREGKVAIVGNCGRGTRLHPGKKDCLILDFGGNILRHGPIDEIKIKEASSSGSGDAPAKVCPKCNSLIHAAYRNCPDCGHEFPPPETSNIETKADTSSILSGEIEDNTYKVKTIYYSVHTKKGADDDTPKTMRIEYEIGMYNFVSEWVCPEHVGWARGKFEDWWKQRSHTTPPQTAIEAVELACAGVLARSEEITVRSISGQKFDRIIAHTIGEIPEFREPGWEDDGGLEPAGVFDNNDDWIDDLPF